MAYVAARGHTLLIPSGTDSDPDKKHLFYILTEICGNGQHLLVPISSIRQNVFHDPTCVIRPGEHPFVKVDSYVVYRRAETITGVHLTKCVDGWVYTKKESAAEVLIERICAGVAKSDFTPGRIAQYFEAAQPKKASQS